MARNKLTDVRDHLIAAMEELMDENVQIAPERLERLNLTNEVGKTIVDSAKAEAMYLRSAAMLSKQSDGYIKPDTNFYQLESKNTPE